MRSRITKRSEHTATHASRVSVLQRAAHKLTGARTQSRQTHPTSPIAGGSGAIWALPTSSPSAAGAADAASATPAVGTRTRRTAPVTCVPVNWDAIRKYSSC